MIVLLFRLFIFAAMIMLTYTAIKFVKDPKRKLELAHEQKAFYFLDNQENVRKNFLLTYKGVMFEGEKYLGTTENSFEVVTVSMWCKQQNRLKGLSRDDFYFIEREVLIHYPNATIDWKNPVKDFLKH